MDLFYIEWGNELARNRTKTRIAFIYDFDGTLSPGNMQEYEFIPGIGNNPSKFWEKVKAEAIEHHADETLIYMREMIKSSGVAKRPTSREEFYKSGAQVTFFPGVEEVTAHPPR